MSKTIKRMVVLIVIILGLLICTKTRVAAMNVLPTETDNTDSTAEAVSITDIESLKGTFEGKNAIVNGNTITLTGDVEFKNSFWTEGSTETKYNTVNLSGNDYVLNLNGYSFSAHDLNIKDGMLTVNDSTKKGIINTTNCLNVSKDAELIIGNGIFNYIRNEGNLTIKNGNFIRVENIGTLTIENGSFETLNQNGNATIKNGLFGIMHTDLILAKNKISGGTFGTENSSSTGIEIKVPYIPNEVNIEEDIKKLIEDGYEPCYDWVWYGSNGQIDGTNYYCLNYGSIIRVAKPTEYELNLIKKMAPDGKNITLKSIKPKEYGTAGFLLDDALNNILNEENYDVHFKEVTEDLSKMTIVIKGETFRKVYYDMNVIYDEPQRNAYVESVINKMKKFNEEDLTTCYQITDLGLINYYMTSSKSELWNIGAPARALRYSDEMIKVSEGGNIKFLMRQAGLGAQDEELMFEMCGGEMTVMYNGYCYDSKTQGVHLRRVIYIPQNTENTKEAYIQAAQKRIDDYLGKDNLVTVKYGGKLDELEKWAIDATVPTEKTDGNYYNITVKDRTYKFYILKGTEEQLKEPIYQGKDHNTNVEIKSQDSSIPLDTSVNAENVESDRIKKALGTKNYRAYEISLYSDAKGSFVKKLENGKFEVTIPIPENLKGKNLAIYYINDSGEKEEYTVEIKDGIVTFETNHFSTYVLTEGAAQEEKDDTPKTGSDNKAFIILPVVIIITIITGAGIYCFKRKN